MLLLCFCGCEGSSGPASGAPTGSVGSSGSAAADSPRVTSAETVARTQVIFGVDGNQDELLDNIPVPSDLLIAPVNATVSVPVPSESAPKYLRHGVESFNTLDGFSTAGNIIIPLDGPVNLDTVSPQSVMVFEQSTGQEVAYTAAVDNSGTPAGRYRLILTPTLPLLSHTSYMVIVTPTVIGSGNGSLVSSLNLEATKSTAPLVDSQGNSTFPGLSNAAAAQLEPVRQRLQPVWARAEAVTKVSRQQIPLALSFTTQTLHTTLQTIRDSAHGRATSEYAPKITLSYTTPEAIDSFYKSSQYLRGLKVFDDKDGNLFVSDHKNVGAIYIGTVSAPWYITDDADGPFVGSGANVQVAEYRDLEFLAILPKGQGPFPSVIFQHGYGSTKDDMGGLANYFCGRGRAVIGVDLVLHGSNAQFKGASSNGYNFFNQDNLQMLRDNLRQSVSNLCTLSRMVQTGMADFDGQAGPELKAGPTSYIGHSEGAIVGGVFAPLESDNAAAVINAGSGPFIPTIQANAGFGPQFDQALTLGGIQPGTPANRIYYFMAQTLVDDGDSSNYLPYALNGGLRGGAPAGATLLIDMFEALDLPAKVAVVGSQGQARALGAPQVSPLQVWPGVDAMPAPVTGSGEFQYQGGGHTWLINPYAGPPFGITTLSARRQALHFINTAEAGRPEIIKVFRGPAPSAAEPTLSTSLPSSVLEDGPDRLTEDPAL